MNDNLDQIINRRSFLRRGSCAALGLAGLGSQLLTSRTIAAALAQSSFTDYKALVCVFLFGGNDNGNTLIPLDGGNQNHADYAAGRGNLAIPVAQLAGTTISPQNTPGRRFTLHPSLTGVKSLFDQGNAAMLANVGTLLQPVSREQFLTGTAPLPSQLFAHERQQEQWQLSRPDAFDGLGWGGRIADVLQSAATTGTTSVSMNISLAGVNAFLAGREVTPYTLSAGGAAKIETFDTSSDQADQIRRAYLDMLSAADDPMQPNRHAMVKAVRDITRRGIVNGEIVDALLQTPSAITTPLPAANPLAAQLATVARMIENAEQGLGHKRQVFFVAIGGFDNHDGLVGPNGVGGPHGQLLRQVDDALVYFWNALGQLNRRNDVTTFTASDFGRTFTSNGNGSDHGWGGHHVVMGGSQLRGNRVYGEFPILRVDGPQDTGLGRYIPTTSVDAYGFELARWMGVPPSEMSTVFPNIGRFLDVRDPATHLGMLA
ncbi:MAG: DUF1501 domain-containing protein [Planctomycetota bacterium]